MKEVFGVIICERMLAESQRCKESTRRFDIRTAEVDGQSSFIEKNEARWRYSSPEQDFMTSRIMDRLTTTAEEGRDNERVLSPWKRSIGYCAAGWGFERMIPLMAAITFVAASEGCVLRLKERRESMLMYKDLIRTPRFVNICTKLRAHSGPPESVSKCTDNSSSAPLERLNMIRVDSR